MDLDKIKKVFVNLEMLTESGDLKWVNNTGIYSCDYLDDKYELCPMMFAINGSLICSTALVLNAAEFYMYLNEKVILDNVINKLGNACDGKIE